MIHPYVNLPFFKIKYEELPEFSEVLACGTAVTLVSISSITRRSTSDRFSYENADELAGPCAQKLSASLREIYKGRADDAFGWLVEVEEPKGFEKQPVTKKRKIEEAVNGVQH